MVIKGYQTWILDIAISTFLHDCSITKWCFKVFHVIDVTQMVLDKQQLWKDDLVNDFGAVGPVSLQACGANERASSGAELGVSPTFDVCSRIDICTVFCRCMIFFVHVYVNVVINMIYQEVGLRPFDIAMEVQHLFGHIYRCWNFLCNVESLEDVVVSYFH